MTLSEKVGEGELKGGGGTVWAVLFSSVTCLDKGRLDCLFVRDLEVVVSSLPSSKRAK